MGNTENSKRPRIVEFHSSSRARCIGRVRIDSRVHGVARPDVTRRAPFPMISPVNECHRLDEDTESFRDVLRAINVPTPRLPSRILPPFPSLREREWKRMEGASTLSLKTIIA